jgi:hypothetical protein
MTYSYGYKTQKISCFFYVSIHLAYEPCFNNCKIPHHVLSGHEVSISRLSLSRAIYSRDRPLELLYRVSINLPLIATFNPTDPGSSLTDLQRQS